MSTLSLLFSSRLVSNVVLALLSFSFYHPRSLIRNSLWTSAQFRSLELIIKILSCMHRTTISVTVTVSQSSSLSLSTMTEKRIFPASKRIELIFNRQFTQSNGNSLGKYASIAVFLFYQTTMTNGKKRLTAIEQ